MSKQDTQPIFATLHVPKVFTTKKNWLGWNVVFDDSSTERILRAKTKVELTLNEYLEQNIDLVANNLVVPFTNILQATKDPLVYTFKIKVYVNTGHRKKLRFAYPGEPVNRIDRFIIELQTSDHGGSHTNTVTIKPPPH